MKTKFREECTSMDMGIDCVDWRTLMTRSPSLTVHYSMQIVQVTVIEGILRDPVHRYSVFLPITNEIVAMFGILCHRKFVIKLPLIF